MNDVGTAQQKSGAEQRLSLGERCAALRRQRLPRVYLSTLIILRTHAHVQVRGHYALRVVLIVQYMRWEEES
jgi:hypothetical protein